MMEALLRPPAVIPLSRFRCVSKSKPWRSLITGSAFRKSHLNKSINHEEGDNNVNPNLLLFSSDSLVIKMHTCSLHSVLHDDSPVCLHDVEPPKRCAFPFLYLLGSCKGIFGVLEGDHDVLLWNPTIKLLRKLPCSGTNHRMYKIFSYGFGYDELNDDFKVVEICCYARLGVNRETIVNVYSLRSNSWRRIKDYEGGIISNSPGVFCNGSLHWLAIHRDRLNTNWSILSLDLSSGIHETTLMPPQFEDGFLSLKLGILKGRLCLFCTYHDLKVDVWMMNEYGKKESWSKFASIPYSLTIPGWISPLSVSKSGEILVQYGHSLLLYNKEDDEFTETEVEMDDSTSLEEAATYTESFVSPHIYGRVREINN